MIVHVTRTGGRLIEARRAQRSFGDGFITAEIRDLQEPWMAHVDAMLADEALVSAVHHALVQRHPQSRRRGQEQLQTGSTLATFRRKSPRSVQAEDWLGIRKNCTGEQV